MSDLPNIVFAAAQNWPGGVALVGGERSLTFRQFADMVGGTAAELTNRGVRPGHRVAIVMENDWRYCLLIGSLISVGAIACPLSTRLPGVGLKAQIGDIATDFFIDSDTRIAADDIGQVGTIDLHDVIAENDASNFEAPVPAAIRTDLPATMIFTSGSASRPKAVMHSYGNHYYSALGSNDNIPVGPGDRWLLSLPLYHVGGLAILFRCLLGGGTVVLPNSSESLAAVVENHRITHLSVVSTQLRKLIEEAEGRDISCLMAVLAGGSAISSNLVDECRRRDLPLYTSYGNTEGASQITTMPMGISINRFKTSGRALNHREICIGDNNEILIKGKTLGLGYVRDRAVEDFTDSDGWFHTGDLGRLDSNGFLSVLGRQDNMFVSGGENIQPEEIERLICEMPDIIEAVVVPKPDEQYGFRPVAFVRSEKGVVLNANEIMNALRRVLPGFKIPVRILPWPEKMSASSMKTDRKVLMRLAEKNRETRSGD